MDVLLHVREALGRWSGSPALGARGLDRGRNRLTARERRLAASEAQAAASAALVAERTRERETLEAAHARECQELTQRVRGAEEQTQRARQVGRLAGRVAMRALRVCVGARVALPLKMAVAAERESGRLMPAPQAVLDWLQAAEAESDPSDERLRAAEEALPSSWRPVRRSAAPQPVA